MNWMNFLDEIEKIKTNIRIYGKRMMRLLVERISIIR